jgi:arabinofuranosyltransferase
VGLCSLAFAAIATRLAWVGDDAYITLRSVENWVTGNGLRWNVADRVQVYTHPLWMLVLALGRAVSGEVFFTAIVTGLVLATTAIAWLLAACRSTVAVLMVAAVVLTAHACGDYATSGLETSLTYLLLVAFAAVATGAPSPRRWLLTALLGALAATNRMDLALLCAPGAAWAMRGLPWRTRVACGLGGALPFAAWLVFATIYYGSPLPVTAHAKAFGLGVPASELLVQGLRYLWQACTTDPVLPAAIALGFVFGLRDRRTRWLAVGMPLYLAYVVKVGGDFMQGRFLLPPFVLALWCLARAERLPVPLLAVPLIGAVLAPPHWLRSPALDPIQYTPEQIDAAHGIVDERRNYYGTQGLLSPLRDGTLAFGAMNRFPIVWPQERTERWIAVGGATGAFGYGAGTLGHLVDPLLCDPLLARLPAADPAQWRIGHVLRRIPEGYLESLAAGENRILHPGLRRYYDALRTITGAPVFDGGRWRVLLAMWRGEFDADLAAFVAEHYRTPPRVAVAAADLAAPRREGCYWFDEPAARLVYDGGLEVHFAGPVVCRLLRAQISGLYTFRFTFRRAGTAVGRSEVAPVGHALEMQRLQTVEVPVPAAAAGFDTIWIDLVVGQASHLGVTRPAFGGLQPVQ